jgi:hypothetical protein
MAQIVTGLFNDRHNADLAVTHLVQAFDVCREWIQVHPFEATDAAEPDPPQDGDFELPLRDLGLPEEAVRIYAEGMRRGGILVAAVVYNSHVERVLGGYRDHSAMDLNVYRAGHSSEAGQQEQRVRAYHL